MYILHLKQWKSSYCLDWAREGWPQRPGHPNLREVGGSWEWLRQPGKQHKVLILSLKKNINQKIFFLAQYDANKKRDAELQKLRKLLEDVHMESEETVHMLRKKHQEGIQDLQDQLDLAMKAKVKYAQSLLTKLYSPDHLMNQVWTFLIADPYGYGITYR